MSSDTRQLLNDIWFEIESESAWTGHEYVFEHFERFEAAVKDLLIKNGIDASSLEKAFESAEKEYEALYAEENDQIPTSQEKRALEDADKHYFEELLIATQALAKAANITNN